MHAVLSMQERLYDNRFRVGMTIRDTQVVLSMQEFRIIKDYMLGIRN